MQKKLLRVPEVARVLDMREGAVYELARRRVLPHVRIGRQIRFDPEALEEFVKSGGRALPGGWRREA